MKTKSLISLLLLFFLSTQAFAGLLYNYHELALKDLDQMNKVVRDKMTESKKSKSGQVVPLKEALQAVYCRPDDDGMIEKIVAPLRVRLEELGLFEKTEENLIQEALNALKNTRNFKPSVQVTYSLFLENTISQFRSAAKSDGFEKKMIEKIAKAEVELTKEAISERKLRLMKESKSPSMIAKEVLEKLSAPEAAVEKPSEGPTAQVEDK